MASLFLGVLTCCAGRSKLPSSCSVVDPIPDGQREPAEVPVRFDVTKLRAYRSYMAVTDVRPAGEHFTLWYFNVEPNVDYLRATRGEDGAITWFHEGGYWGSLGVPGHVPSPVPRAVAGFAEDLVLRLEKRCPGARDSFLEYEGNYRRVTVREFVIHQAYRPETQVRGGWNSSVVLAMDEDLTKVVRVVSYGSGFGVIESRDDVQWLRVPTRADAMPWTIRGELGAFAEAIAEGARQYAANQPSIDPLSLVDASAPLLPEDLIGRLQVEVYFYANGLEQPNPSRSDRFEVRALLDLSEAVFGPAASGEGSVTIGADHFRLRAVLTPAQPHALASTYAQHMYAGTLSLEISGDHGQLWRQDLSPSGLIETEGTRVVAPYGIDIPGTAAQFHEPNPLHDTLPAQPPFKNVDFYVQQSVFFDPRD